MLSIQLQGTNGTRDCAIPRTYEVREMVDAPVAALVVYGSHTKFDSQVIEELVSSKKHPLLVNEAGLAQCVSVIDQQVHDG